MIQPLIVVLICLVMAYVFSEGFRQFGLPRVVGQITAGLILGAVTLRYNIFSVESLDILSFLANLGIILLFYYVGLEMNFNTFTKNMRRSVLISLFNTSLPLIIGFVSMKLFFGFSTIASIIIGVSLSVSAQSVSIDILEELKMLRSRIGNMIISAGAVDDIIELVIVTMILSFFHVVVSNLTALRLVIDIIIFLIFIVIARVWLLPLSLKFFDREKSSTSRFMGSMIIVIIIASMSEWLGTGLLIGAMIAGIIVRQTIFKEVTIPNWEEHDIARSTHIIAFGFLIPVFFVWIGMSTNILFIVQKAGLILVLTAIATAGTVGGTIVAVMLNKGLFKEGMVIGWGLNPKGDIELVIAALALKSAIITQDIFTALVIMSLLTTVISLIVFKRLAARHKASKHDHAA